MKTLLQQTLTIAIRFQNKFLETDASQAVEYS